MATTLMIGTTKGAVLLRSDDRRQGWTVTGPLRDAWPMNHVAGDPVRAG